MFVSWTDWGPILQNNQTEEPASNPLQKRFCGTVRDAPQPGDASPRSRKLVKLTPDARQGRAERVRVEFKEWGVGVGCSLAVLASSGPAW